MLYLLYRCTRWTAVPLYLLYRRGSGGVRRVTQAVMRLLPLGGIRPAEQSLVGPTGTFRLRMLYTLERTHRPRHTLTSVQHCHLWRDSWYERNPEETTP